METSALFTSSSTRRRSRSRASCCLIVLRSLEIQSVIDSDGHLARDLLHEIHFVAS